MDFIDYNQEFYNAKPYDVSKDYLYHALIFDLNERGKDRAKTYHCEATKAQDAIKEVIDLIESVKAAKPPYNEQITHYCVLEKDDDEIYGWKIIFNTIKEDYPCAA